MRSRISVLILPILLTACFVVFSLPVALAQEAPVYTDPFDQYGPAISGNIVVWVDSSRRGIYMKDLSTGIESPVCTDPPGHGTPDVSGNIVVWVDERNFNDDIYMKDLSTGIESPVCTNPARQVLPAVSGNVVIWVDYHNGEWPWGPVDIYMKDLSTGIESPVCTGLNLPGTPSPDISGNIVVWEDIRDSRFTNIYMKDLSTGIESPVSTASTDQWTPAISGNIVVWVDMRNFNFDIYMYDISTGIESPVCTEPGMKICPAVSGNIIVWADLRNGNWDIYMYDISTGIESPVCTDPASQSIGLWGPDVSGNIVVWEDLRNGNYDIYMKDLRTDTEPPKIAISTPVGTVTSNSVPISVSITDPSGVDSYSYAIDGVPVACTATSLDLTYFTPGIHTFTVTATDSFGNSATVNSTFTYFPDATALGAILTRMYADGEMTKLGSSISNKLDRVRAYLDLGDYERARVILQVLADQINAQTSIHISSYAANILLMDIRYLMSTLP